MDMVKRVFGLITVLIGVALLGWTIYGHLNPEAHVSHGRLLGGFVAPIIIISVGVKWMLGLRGR